VGGKKEGGGRGCTGSKGNTYRSRIVFKTKPATLEEQAKKAKTWPTGDKLAPTNGKLYKMSKGEGVKVTNYPRTEIPGGHGRNRGGERLLKNTRLTQTYRLNQDVKSTLMREGEGTATREVVRGRVLIHQNLRRENLPGQRRPCESNPTLKTG